MSRHAHKDPEIRKPEAELPLFAEQNFYKFEQQHSALPEPVPEKFAPRMRHSQDYAQGSGTANTAGTGLEANEGPSQKQVHGEQKSCLTAPLSAHGESGDCRSLSGTGSPRDVARARRSDPQTSRIAAGRVTNSQKVKRAIYRILSIYGPLTDEQLIVQYRRGDDMPLASDQSIRSRRSDLVHDGIVCDSGELGKTEMGNPAIKWRLK